MSEQVYTLFSGMGGRFCSNIDLIGQKLSRTRAFLFDWDGVFNNAAKNENHSSTFNEVDSMGSNMLRFSFFCTHNVPPFTGIISGESNKLAFDFSKREHFNACYYKVPHKLRALEHFCHSNSLDPKEVCYVFDDVLDLSIAQVCGLRILIKRKANPLFENYVVMNNLADYITASESGNFAVREICELLIGIYGNYDDIMNERTLFSEIYQDYLRKRQSVTTQFFSMKEMNIVTGDI